MERIIALAGNPNVGKSTLFNALTGMHQHTGNWSGKTVETARGRVPDYDYTLIDLPGTYSLIPHSAEEEIARDFICFGRPDTVLVVCDATCLERNLNLVLQVLEVAPRTVVCLNLSDEAAKKKIRIDAEQLSARLGVEVVPTVARKRASVKALLKAIGRAEERTPYCIPYPAVVEDALEELAAYLRPHLSETISARWLCLQLLSAEPVFLGQLTALLPDGLPLSEILDPIRQRLLEYGYDRDRFSDMQTECIVREAEELCRDTVTYEDPSYRHLDRTLDRILTGRRWGYPVMLLLLALVFWITVKGANYPSQWLSALFARLGDWLTLQATNIGIPPLIKSALISGVYRVLTWVISVMLPPMAIFFPLFTLLEDMGYLPRIAYNLDRPFARCNACGKQALTMCMGFGCNAVGVTGCRIIDSPRERLLAVLTNSLVPCNGRFPLLIALLSIFFASGSGVAAALLLTLLILLCVVMTFGVTWILSHTLCRGEASSFALELPPYRRPQIGRVLVRSVLDRTLFVLGRAATVAAPAGLVIWALANSTVDDQSLLMLFSGWLDPLGRLMGMDGVLILAFILGFPANEIVLPVALMTYLSQGAPVELGDYAALKTVLVQNGWTWLTALCTILFSLFHWPCSTTLLTVKKETGSLKWTILAAVIPTLIGMLLCILLAQIFG